MRNATPHYLLFTKYDSSREDDQAGSWEFMLESVGTCELFEASGKERDVFGERLELLAVVRGLEAIDQPSRVTLVTPSRYVARGIKFGLPQWRDAGWRWESYGTLVPVKNGDLWQRIDQAMKYHEVACRRWEIDHDSVSSTSDETTSESVDVQEQVA